MKRLCFLLCVFISQLAFTQITKDDLLEMAGYVPLDSSFTTIDFTDHEKLRGSEIWLALQETDLFRSMKPTGAIDEIGKRSLCSLKVKLIIYKPFRYDPTGTKNFPESYSGGKANEEDLNNVKTPFGVYKAIVSVYRLQNAATFREYLKSEEGIVRDDSLFEGMPVYSFHTQAGILSDRAGGNRFLILVDPDIAVVVDDPKLLLQLQRAYSGEVQTLAEDYVFLDVVNSGRLVWDQWTLSDSRYMLEQARIQAVRRGGDVEAEVDAADSARLLANPFYRLYTSSFESDQIISAEINVFKNSDHFNSCLAVPSMKELYQEQKAQLGENITLEIKDDVLIVTTRKSKEQALEKAKIMYQIGMDRLEKQKNANINRDK